MDYFGEMEDFNQASMSMKPSPCSSNWTGDYSDQSAEKTTMLSPYTPYQDSYHDYASNSPVSSGSGGPMRAQHSAGQHHANIVSPYARPSSTLSSSSLDVVPATPAPCGSQQRGRPPKATSNSKMASYARSYREMKKNQMVLSQQQNEELKRENMQLRQDNMQLVESLSRFEKEVLSLRKVINKNTNVAAVVSRLTGSGGATTSTQSPLSGLDGVCLHLSGGKVTVEVCEQCSHNSSGRQGSSQEVTVNHAPEVTVSEEPVEKKWTIDTTPLFNGDFDSISEFVR